MACTTFITQLIHVNRRTNQGVAGAHQADNNSLLPKTKIGNRTSNSVKIRRESGLLVDKLQVGRCLEAKGSQRCQAMHGQTMTEGIGMPFPTGFLRSNTRPRSISTRRKSEIR
jgi:hypothetical protein